FEGETQGNSSVCAERLREGQNPPYIVLNENTKTDAVKAFYRQYSRALCMVFVVFTVRHALHKLWRRLDSLNTNGMPQALLFPFSEITVMIIALTTSSQSAGFMLGVMEWDTAVPALLCLAGVAALMLLGAQKIRHGLCSKSPLACYVEIDMKHGDDERLLAFERLYIREALSINSTSAVWLSPAETPLLLRINPLWRLAEAARSLSGHGPPKGEGAAGGASLSPCASNGPAVYVVDKGSGQVASWAWKDLSSSSFASLPDTPRTPLAGGGSLRGAPFSGSFKSPPGSFALGSPEASTEHLNSIAESECDGSRDGQGSVEGCGGRGVGGGDGEEGGDMAELDRDDVPDSISSLSRSGFVLRCGVSSWATAGTAPIFCARVAPLTFSLTTSWIRGGRQPPPLPSEHAPPSCAC
ncbi:hypothetical protein CYMTET_34564, partial [Cymbomonas tetramitiformis]